MSSIRPWRNFRADPSSLRYATAALVSLTAALVAVGAVLIRILDAEEYPAIGDAVWFMLQTVTTVGYGDNPPASSVGRFVTSVVMLSSVGLITVITAVVTSLFIQSGSNEQRRSNQDDTAAGLARIESSLAETQQRLDSIEERMAQQSPDRNGET